MLEVGKCLASPSTKEIIFSQEHLPGHPLLITTLSFVGQGPLLSFGAGSHSSSCLQPYNFSLFWCLFFFAFFPPFFLKIKTAESLPSFHGFSQCEAERLNGLGVTEPTSCRWVCFPVIVSDFIENVCVIFQHALRAGKVKACPLEKAFLMCHGMHTYPR